jgi:hypothetical protein
MKSFALLGLVATTVLGGCIILDEDGDDDGCFGSECGQGASGNQAPVGGEGGAGAQGPEGGQGGEGGSVPACDPAQNLCPCDDAVVCGDGLSCVAGHCAEPCNFDFECASGEVCASGECLSSCSDEAPCQDGFLCSAGACLPDPSFVECTMGSECESGLCADGLCRAPCVTNLECAEDFVCDATNAACVVDTSPTPSCSDDLPCTGAGQSCVDGVCRYPCETLEACKLIDARFDACDVGICKTQEELEPECSFELPCAGGAPCISNVCLE